MAELATIARPYAEALFKSAGAAGADNLASTAAWVDELAAIAGDSGLQQFAGKGDNKNHNGNHEIKMGQKIDLQADADKKQRSKNIIDELVYDFFCLFRKVFGVTQGDANDEGTKNCVNADELGEGCAQEAQHHRQ